MKLELNELDKLQKQLDTKRNMRDNNKIQSTTNILRRGKDQTINLKDSGKMVKSTPQTQIKGGHDLRSTKSKNTVNIPLSGKV